MSMSLSQHLYQYAVEAGEINDDPSFIGAEEVTVVTDDTETELGEAIQDMADSVEKIAEHNGSAEKMIDAVDSMESFVGQIQAMRANGQPLTEQGAQFFIQGVVASLEAREIPTQIFENEVMGLQHSFESGAVSDYSTEAEEQSEGILRRLYNMLKAAGAAALQALKDFFVTFGKSAKAIEQAGGVVQRIANGLKGEAEGDLKGSSYKALVVGSDVDAVTALKMIRGGYKSGIDTIREGIKKSFNELSAAMNDPTPAKINSAAKELHIADGSIKLPGGVTATFKLGDGEGMNKVGGTSTLAGLFRKGAAAFSISKVDASAPEKVKPASKEQIKEIGLQLVSLGQEMNAAMKAAAKEAEDYNKLTKAADKAVTKTQGATKEEVALARDLIKCAQGAVKVSSSIIPTYTKYAGGVAKIAYAFAKASASKYKGSGDSKVAGNLGHDKDSKKGVYNEPGAKEFDKGNHGRTDSKDASSLHSKDVEYMRQQEEEAHKEDHGRFKKD